MSSRGSRSSCDFCRVRLVCRAVGRRPCEVLGDDPLGSLMRGALGAPRRRGLTERLDWGPVVRWALGDEHRLRARALGDDPRLEARWLLDRAQRGDLDRERLEVAAHALEPGARAALGRLEDEAPDPSLEPWIAGLGRRGGGWAPRAAVWFAAEAVDPFSEWGPLPAAREGAPDPLLAGTRVLLGCSDVLRRWADAPGPGSLAALAADAAALDALARPALLAQHVEGAHVEGAHVDGSAGRSSGRSAPEVLRAALRLARGAAPPLDACLGLVRRAAAGCLDPVERGSSLRRTVAWWALRAGPTRPHDPGDAP